MPVWVRVINRVQACDPLGFCRVGFPAKRRVGCSRMWFPLSSLFSRFDPPAIASTAPDCSDGLLQLWRGAEIGPTFATCPPGSAPPRGPATRHLGGLGCAAALGRRARPPALSRAVLPMSALRSLSPGCPPALRRCAPETKISHFCLPLVYRRMLR